ncbi:hypothetical protein K493DRAFT_292160 [Basidiobolus meristosporus CBS 931.73]|uniref:chitin synthase n=1 Tax=Basidiobolus meristosporus CBS 931.73 TaxID=1314790 RepID=A0A1Y1XAT9_9FUNG|nr:hypothetical protein K493DRAFT_292160 [Basidiobolus meristosporus CBS 931.73]|eukprot:ORX82891.1 hypothetical protein K493DRAFT_292160 [Basidiobolus meristosporus CBS 931.73]
MNIIAAIVVQRTVGKYKLPADPAEKPKKLLALHIPCYSESKEVILKTVNSVVQSEYDDESKLLFVVADGDVTGAGNDKSTPRILIEDVFKCETEAEPLIYQSVGHGDQRLNKACVYTGYYSPEGEPDRKIKYLLVVKVGLESEREAAKPGNRSKRDSQLVVYNFFREANGKIRFSCPMFAEMYNSLKRVGCNAKDVEYVLVADADTFIRPNGLDILVQALEKDPKLSGVCGETKVENRTQSYITMIQVFEYFLTHCLLKSFESFYANVLVLSGCFTIYRLKRHSVNPDTGKKEVRPAVLDPRIMRDYMAEPKLMREHNLLTIGEDRYLCTLVIRYLTDMRTRYIPSAVCTTTVPDQLSVLLCQRRRWTNSLIHNHFDLFVNPPAFPTWRMRWSMKLVMVSELWSASAIPFFLPLGCCIAIWGLWTHLTWLSLGFTIVLFCLPGLIALMAGRKTQACWWFMFIFGLPLWAVVIPLYSLWKMDDFSWGSTRPTYSKTILESVQEIKPREVDPHSEPQATAINIPE